MLFLIFNMNYATWLFPRAGDSFVAQPDHLPKTYGYDIWMDWPYIKKPKKTQKCCATQLCLKPTCEFC